MRVRAGLHNQGRCVVDAQRDREEGFRHTCADCLEVSVFEESKEQNSAAEASTIASGAARLTAPSAPARNPHSSQASP